MAVALQYLHVGDTLWYADKKVGSPVQYTVTEILGDTIYMKDRNGKEIVKKANNKSLFISARDATILLQGE